MATSTKGKDAKKPSTKEPIKPTVGKYIQHSSGRGAELEKPIKPSVGIYNQRSSGKGAELDLMKKVVKDNIRALKKLADL